MSVTYTFPPVSSPCYAEINPFQPYFRRNCIPFAVAVFFGIGSAAFLLSALRLFVALFLCLFSTRATFHFPFFAPISLPPAFSRHGFLQCTICSATSRSILPHSLLSHHPAASCARHPAEPTDASTLFPVTLFFLPSYFPTFAAITDLPSGRGHKKRCLPFGKHLFLKAV